MIGALAWEGEDEAAATIEQRGSDSGSDEVLVQFCDATVEWEDHGAAWSKTLAGFCRRQKLNNVLSSRASPQEGEAPERSTCIILTLHVRVIKRWVSGLLGPPGCRI